MRERSGFRTKAMLALGVGLVILVLAVLSRRDRDAPTVVVYTSVDQVFSEPILQQ